MSDTERARDDGRPAPFFVYYNPRAHLIKLVAILAICAVLVLVPLTAEGANAESAQILFLLVVIFLVWAYLSLARLRDRRPQVVVDADGIFVRDWHAGVVPWADIEFIAHSSSVRRSMISALTRSRRGPYLLFKFTRKPQFVASLPAPLSWLQQIWVDMELQEPVIMEFGTDTKATTLLRVIQEHIAYWQAQQPAPTGDAATIVSPQPH